MLIRREIWLTETPSVAGAMSLRIRFTPGSRKVKSNLGNMPIRRNGAICSASCKAPPMNTAQASAATGGLKYGAAKSAIAMNEIFSRTGVKAGTANRLQVLSTPPESATTDWPSLR